MYIQLDDLGTIILVKQEFTVVLVCIKNFHIWVLLQVLHCREQVLWKGHPELVPAEANTQFTLKTERIWVSIVLSMPRFLHMATCISS